MFFALGLSGTRSMAFKIMFHIAINFLNQKYVIVVFDPRFLFLSFFCFKFFLSFSVN